MSENVKEYDKAIDYLIDLIRNKKIVVGDKIPSERVLSKDLGIGRNSIREALRKLENMGVIESRAGSGSYVTLEISNNLSEMFEMMFNLEEYSRMDLNIFRKNMDMMVCAMLIDNCVNLNDITNRAEELLDREKTCPAEEIEIDRSFHFFLINETKNKFLISLMQATSEVYRSAIDSVLAACSEEERKGFDDAHRQMIKALRNGSKAQCEEAVELHYKRVDDIVKKAKLDEFFNRIKNESVDVQSTFKESINKDEEEYYDNERDYLTGLYTKEVFFKKVEKYIEENPEKELVLWASDIQGLRFINEKHGMEIGDKVLRVIASGGDRYEDYIFGGRIDGGSLCALMEDHHLDYNYVNSSIMEDYDPELPVPNVVVKSGVYHIKKSDKLHANAMYVKAVVALQSIKNSCDYVIKEYDDKMREEFLINRQMEEDAKKALARGDFKVYFQPKIDVSKNCVAGAEALVRWIHPELGFMSPGMFIPLFEQNGFIAKLDLYVWEQVCKAIVEWKEKGIPIIPVSVNVSKKSFEDENLAKKIIELVDKYNIDHSLIEIEITEYSCLDNMDKIKKTIRSLHKTGFPIALDDFGTGYSSMVVLSTLDLDIMKIDMSLIKNDDPTKKKNALEFSLQLAKMMQLKTVAEGIETEEQVFRIKSLGGDYIQGYFYSKPLPKEEFEKYVEIPILN